MSEVERLKCVNELYEGNSFISIVGINETTETKLINYIRILHIINLLLRRMDLPIEHLSFLANLAKNMKYQTPWDGDGLIVNTLYKLCFLQNIITLVVKFIYLTFEYSYLSPCICIASSINSSIFFL